jgi:hypothetical protein
MVVKDEMTQTWMVKPVKDKTTPMQVTCSVIAATELNASPSMILNPGHGGCW